MILMSTRPSQKRNKEKLHLEHCSSTQRNEVVQSFHRVAEHLLLKKPTRNSIERVGGTRDCDELQFSCCCVPQLFVCRLVVSY
jgi:hypothetical protein